MRKLLERIRAGKVLVADGAVGTMLLERGLSPGQAPESLNLERPELLTEIARLYLNAGAEIIQTNTFGGSPLKLAHYHLDDKTEEINRSAVAAVQQAVEGKAYISGSCGPSGRLLKPYGDTHPGAVFAGFERQMRALITAGVDVICVETMTDINEAVLAVRAAKAVSAEKPVMATMTFDSTPRGFFTVMGVSIEQACAELEGAGADIIGSNCSNGMEKMIAIAEEFRRKSKLPIVIQPNAGLPQLIDGKVVYLETPQVFADGARRLLDLGVSIIGGCCGTTPEHIKAIKQVVGKRRGENRD
jgi:5-methyltetrahydrofolate--homocysteine methyltransferase